MDFTKSYDVVVAGGGIAGVAAALASARRGKKTALIEKTVYTGGLATTGLINVYLPLCDGSGTQVSHGITEELLKVSLKYGPGEIPANWENENNAHEEKRYRAIFNPASLTLAMDELLMEAGVDVWFDTLICDTVVEDKTVKGIEVENKSGRGLIHSKCVVDATGDADIAHRAGMDCPVEANHLAMWALEYVESDKKGGLGSNISMYVAGGFDKAPVYRGINGESVSEFTLKSRAEYADKLKKAYADGTSDRNSQFPIHFPAMASYRKSRRIEGVFTLSDGMEWTAFEDSVGVVADWRKSNYVWEIPYRSLIPKDYKGFMAVGRCMASEGDAWEVTRVIPVAGLTGEVAGVAAAMSVDKGISPDELDYKELQKELVKDRKYPLHFEELGLTAPKQS